MSCSPLQPLNDNRVVLGLLREWPETLLQAQFRERTTRQGAGRKKLLYLERYVRDDMI